MLNSNDERSRITSASVCKHEDVNGILAVVDARLLYWIPITYLDSYEDSCCVADLSLAVPVTNPTSNITRENTNPNASGNTNENETKQDSDLDMGANINRNGNYTGDNDEKQTDSNEKRMRKQFRYLSVKNIVWSPCSKRVIVQYNENEKVLALCSFDRQHLYPIGIMQQVHPNYELRRACDAVHVVFRDNVKRGAVVAVLWDSGVITQHRLMFE